MSGYLLSIVAPVKNEVKYIEELTSTFLEVDDERVELVISDNFSDDGTFEKVKCINNPNIRVLRPEKALTPFDNHKYAIQQSSGEFVFPLGGDDYISPSCISIILDKLQPGKIIVPIIRCFEDKSYRTIQNTNTKQQIELLFNDKGLFDIRRYLGRINYDELIFNVCEKKLLNHLNSIRPNTVETFATWANIFLFSNINLDQVEFVDCVLLNKRYGKIYDKSAFGVDQGYNKTTIYTKSVNAIYNIFIFYSMKRDLMQSVYLSLFNRYAVGYYNQDFPDKKIKKMLSISPFLMVLGYPILVIRNYFKNHS